MQDFFVSNLDEISESLRDRSEVFILPSKECIEISQAALKAGKKLFICGNGGSASTASHIANDLSCHMKNWHREGYKVICLNDSTAVLTSLTNDYGFEHVFSKPLEALSSEGDVLWAFSTSGNSKNVIQAVEAAKKRNLKSVVFTGRNGGKLKTMGDVWVSVNSDDVLRVEELHMIYAHSIAVSVEALVSPMEV
jgi:D-sedoheptulose 7-phosphate isomerase